MSREIQPRANKLDTAWPHLAFGKQLTIHKLRIYSIQLCSQVPSIEMSKIPPPPELIGFGDTFNLTILASIWHQKLPINPILKPFLPNNKEINLPMDIQATRPLCHFHLLATHQAILFNPIISFHLRNIDNYQSNTSQIKHNPISTNLHYTTMQPNLWNSNQFLNKDNFFLNNNNNNARALIPINGVGYMSQDFISDSNRNFLINNTPNFFCD